MNHTGRTPQADISMGHTMFSRYPIVQRQFVGHSAMRSMPGYPQQFAPNPSPLYRNDVIFMDQPPPQAPPCVHTAHPPSGTPGWPPPCSQCHNTTRGVVFGMGGHIHPAHHHHHGIMATHPMTPCVSNVPLYHQRLWYNQHRIQEMQRRRMDMMNK